MHKRGFTLIELLIVIGLLGTLAVALLAAIDPFEQFLKGTDTGVRNTVQEFYNASIRYYAQKNAWPTTWPIAPTGVTTIDFNDATTQDTMIDPLIQAGELKSNFKELGAAQLNKMTASIVGTKMLVCFMPGSKGIQNDNNTRYTDTVLDDSGVPTTDDTATPQCPTNQGTSTCYWCIY